MKGTCKTEITEIKLDGLHLPSVTIHKTKQFNSIMYLERNIKERYCK